MCCQSGAAEAALELAIVNYVYARTARTAAKFKSRLDAIRSSIFELGCL
jgi:hypothetical protein